MNNMKLILNFNKSKDKFRWFNVKKTTNATKGQPPFTIHSFETEAQIWLFYGYEYNVKDLEYLKLVYG